MKSADIRSKFIDFFKQRGHQPVPSGPLVPPDDPTLLFTNAGMVQFKRVFQGLERRDYSRAVTCQKCVRAGGKHNDLEQVGHTARHHTFFEMLGNFSFGQYFKKEAIEYAWEWVTSPQWLGIDPDRLYVTVHHTDDEARKLWRQVTGIADSRIYRLSDKDNFWQMGDTGPCGPCSEILVDIRSRERGAGSRDPSLDDFVSLSEEGKLLEIWNLVFMQFDQQPDGSRKNLPKPSVDTGAGLERIASVMQNVPSNFDTDLFLPIIDRAAELVGIDNWRKSGLGEFMKVRRIGAPNIPLPDTRASLNVLADHARTVAFLVGEGLFPSNEGRGYVLRRILRRAVRYAWLLGRREPTLADLTGVVVDQMQEVYHDLSAKRGEIATVTRGEEERFLETIEAGLRRLDQLADVPVISGEEVFKLYSTFGFPPDLTQLIAAERGQMVDLQGFDVAMNEQRRRSRSVRAHDSARLKESARVHVNPVTADWVMVHQAPQQWIGYERTRAETNVLALRRSGNRTELVLEQNPFYAESGGQVSDTGVVKGDGWELTVDDVKKMSDGRAVLLGHADLGSEVPTQVEAQVNELRRRNIERNHTATHLVHAALRKILGTHVRQAGSVVAPDRLRFDFSHGGPIQPDLLLRIEEEVNEHVWENHRVETRDMPYKEAIAAGAMALFSEKYGSVVRVVDVPGISLELCGGTHVASTGEIGVFRFRHETGAAAGVRRIEALTGWAAYRYAIDLQNRLSEAAGLLKTQPEHLIRRIEGMLEENKRLEKRVEDLLRGGGETNKAHVQQIGGVEFHISRTEVEDRNQIALMMDAFRASHPSSVSLIVSGSAAMPSSIHVGVGDSLLNQGMLKAGELVKFISSSTDGKGGGRPHFASGSIGDPAKISSNSTLIEMVSTYLEKKS